MHTMLDQKIYCDMLRKDPPQPPCTGYCKAETVVVLQDDVLLLNLDSSVG